MTVKCAASHELVRMAAVLPHTGVTCSNQKTHALTKYKARPDAKEYNENSILARQTTGGCRTHPARLKHIVAIERIRVRVIRESALVDGRLSVALVHVADRVAIVGRTATELEQAVGDAVKNGASEQRGELGVAHGDRFGPRHLANGGETDTRAHGAKVAFVERAAEALADLRVEAERIGDGKQD